MRFFLTRRTFFYSPYLRSNGRFSNGTVIMGWVGGVARKEQLSRRHVLSLATHSLKVAGRCSVTHGGCLLLGVRPFQYMDLRCKGAAAPLVFSQGLLPPGGPVGNPGVSSTGFSGWVCGEGRVWGVKSPLPVSNAKISCYMYKKKIYLCKRILLYY